ncbi:MAG: EAL domain-containing protein [Gammaproteobacteria bacterium]|nr:EAL domain-containing protein [Gammaproteobacteria bacterium]
MLKRRYSFKFIILIAMLGLIILAYGLVFHSTQVYRELAIENQTDALQSLVALKTRDIIEQVRRRQKDFAVVMQSHPQFIQALNELDETRMEAWMLQYFAEQTEANPDLNLKTIVVRNLDGEVLSQASDTDLLGFTGCPAPYLLSSMPAESELKPRYTLCKYEGVFYSEALLPSDPLKPKAYLQVLVNIVKAFQQLQHAIDLPLRILAESGDEIFRSEQWPEAADDRYLMTMHRVFTTDNLPGVDIFVAFDQQPFINQLDRTEAHFLVLTSLWTMAIVGAVLVLLMIVFRPLNNLRNSMGAMLTGKYALITDEKLPTELRDLVHAYNDMVVNLETETISRREIEEKLRSEKDFIATTLNSIQNPVIVVDSKQKIKLTNPVAEKFFGEKETDLIDKSIHELLILYSNRQTTRIVDITRLLNQKKNWSTMFYHHPDLRVVELEFSASPMIDMETEDIGYVIILKDVSEDRQLRRKLNYEGSHDQLTGFLNRLAFEQKFETVVVEGSSGSTQHVLAYLDIDQFKVVNETCGNVAGDRLLNQVARILQARVRKSDILSRLSGDEFGIIMPFFEMKMALEVMQNIIIDIQHSGFVWQDKEYHVTASIGVMAFGQMRDEYSDFYSKVTTACSLAKENGGNQYHFIDEDDKKVVAQHESMDWVSGIMKGFTENRFCLYVQPIVSLNPDEEFSHYEVLIRYRNHDGTIVPPGDFLPPAERYNLIEKIDSWVVMEMIGWLRKNHKKVEGKMFSVNLSGRSIGSETFHRFLEKSLTESGVDLENLCFEITETAAVDNVEKSVDFISSIKQLGAKISLDDFGTGLSSFSYLKQFPVDYLKIDGEFIRDIIDDDKSFVFVRSMTELGHCLDMKVIAEFVESDTMFDRLRDANIDYIQGYTVGEPVDIETLISSDSGSGAISAESPA